MNRFGRPGLLVILFIVVLAGLWRVWEIRQPVRFMAVGDILVDRGVRQTANQFGYDDLFTGVSDQLRRGDLVLANLEGPLTAKSIPLAKPIAFRGDPAMARSLRKAGINLVTLANNHTMDCGRDGLLETIETVRRSGITPIGAGRNEALAHRPVVMAKNGLRIAFLAYSTFPLEGLVYQPELPTISLGRDPKRVRQDILQAKQQADLVIVTYHWGDEFTPQTTKLQRDLAYNAIDAGADLVLGHHPHVLQPAETYHGKRIVYSLGNFVFDHRGTDQRKSMIFSCELTRDGVQQIRMIPVQIKNCRPITVHPTAH